MTNEDLHLMVGRIDANVATLLTMQQGTETRVRSLEKWRWWQTGAAAVVGAIAAKFGMHT